MSARVVVLAGPSGSGKTVLADRLALPVLRLDDFYRDGDDPALPRIGDGANAGLIDWDDSRSWRGEEAMAALATLCHEGRVEVPVYSIPDNGRVGVQTLTLDDSTVVVAEGIFAAEVVGPLGEAGLLAAAYCLTQHPLVTFWRRLVRDLREHRKPPPVLVRRGLTLMRAQRSVVAAAVAAGCRAVTPERAYTEVMALTTDPGLKGSPIGPRPGSARVLGRGVRRLDHLSDDGQPLVEG